MQTSGPVTFWIGTDGNGRSRPVRAVALLAGAVQRLGGVLDLLLVLALDRLGQIPGLLEHVGGRLLPDGPARVFLLRRRLLVGRDARDGGDLVGHLLEV